ncbi:hypothetical protein BX661DRAFT_196133 [Kickxella alabastrina]|uniref:uncharacterized protein n=1 Tax=Kickxella alabastrina TaxID=61397 RepID=UPI0022210CB0|nr:uncharacterized protein BX661DRAFT_196133 [Kickxella alabastrina]KAI7833604.1 hypothetical protein BX661DRAFT_196133 [Kickxella alabastrina]
MNSNGSAGRAAKRVFSVLVCTSSMLRCATAGWLTVSIALSSYAQLWRTYSESADYIDNGAPGGDRNKQPPSTLASEWLVLLVSIISYSGLALQLALIPIYALRLMLASVLVAPRAIREPSDLLRSIIEYSWAVPVCLLAAVSNFVGIVDITAAPLLADILVGIWRLCAIFGAVLTLTALPAFMATAARYRRLPSDGRPKLLPWYLLFLPGTVAGAAASELTLVLPPSRASGVLAAGYALWGASVVPALVFSILYIRQLMAASILSRAVVRPGGSLLVMPLAPVSQLALGIMTLGIQSQRVWADTVGPATAPLLLGELAMAAGAILGLILWGASTAWFINSHILLFTLQSSSSSSSSNRRRRGLGICIVGKVAFRTLTDSCQPVYPLASFALATAVVARIWSSVVMLALTRVLIAYLSIVLATVGARKTGQINENESEQLVAGTADPAVADASDPDLAPANVQSPSSPVLYGTI